MTDTANLGLPFIDGSQAQKHVTHNEALRILDNVVQISVRDTALSSPPSTPANRERYIVAAGATGAWAGQAQTIAVWEDNAWRFLTPKTGWLVWSESGKTILVFDGSAWTPVTTDSASFDNAPRLGINTTAGSPNLLSVRSNAALFNAIDTSSGGTGDVRLQLSKTAVGNTASVVFSDAFSGRAEFGLTGDDDFRLKVSADGATWRDAMKFDRATGRVSFPSGGAREMLSADRTYYVRTDGNDSNNGMTDTPSRAFRTLQRAWNAILTLDLNGFTITVQVGAGTYTNGVDMLVPPMSGIVNFLGDATTPSNVVLSTTADDCFNLACPATVGVKGFKLQTAASGFGLLASSGGAQLNFGNIDFGAAASGHIRSLNGALIANNGLNYAISGGVSGYHMSAAVFGGITINGGTVALAGTPTLTGFVQSRQGTVSVVSVTYLGAAIGIRYSVDLNGVINTFGGGQNYFPGSAAGLSATGGQYT